MWVETTHSPRIALTWPSGGRGFNLPGELKDGPDDPLGVVIDGVVAAALQYPVGLEAQAVEERLAKGGEGQHAVVLAPDDAHRRCIPRQGLDGIDAAPQEFTGDAAPEAARELDVSPGTIKWHVRNSYGKLGAFSKEDALAKAKVRTRR